MILTIIRVLKSKILNGILSGVTFLWNQYKNSGLFSHLLDFVSPILHGTNHHHLSDVTISIRINLYKPFMEKIFFVGVLLLLLTLLVWILSLDNYPQDFYIQVLMPNGLNFFEKKPTWAKKVNTTQVFEFAKVTLKKLNLNKLPSNSIWLIACNFSSGHVIQLFFFLKGIFTKNVTPFFPIKNPWQLQRFNPLNDES